MGAAEAAPFICATIPFVISCEFENGNRGALRHVVVNAVVARGDKILLAKRDQSLIEGGKWDLPGGLVDRDETLEQAVAREVLEETGWEAHNFRLARISSNPARPGDENRQNIVFIYFCEATERTGKPDWETSDVKWFPINQLPPESEIAFDQMDCLRLYRRYRDQKLALPLVV